MAKTVASDLNFAGNARCVNLPDPVNAQDVATKTYADRALTGDVTKAAGSQVTAIGTGVIVNADVSASAAIALSKLGLASSTSILVTSVEFQRAALTGAVTASQNSNSTAFGSAAARTALANVGSAAAVPSFVSIERVAGAEYFDTTVDVPALASGAVAYVDVDVTFTILDPLASDAFVVVMPRADIVPFSARVAGAQTVRLGFQGATSASAAVPIRIYRVDTDPASVGYVPPASLVSSLGAWFRVANASTSGGAITGIADTIAGRLLSQGTLVRCPALATVGGYPVASPAGSHSLRIDSANVTALFGSSMGTCGLAAYVAGTGTLARWGNDGSSTLDADTFRIEILSGSIVFDVHVGGAGLNYRRARTPNGVVNGSGAQAKFVTVEYFGTGATEVDQVVITVDSVVQTLTFSTVGTAAAMPTALRGGGTICTLNRRHGNNDTAMTGQMGPNIYLFNAQMAGVTAGLLTPTMRAALARFERPI